VRLRAYPARNGAATPRGRGRGVVRAGTRPYPPGPAAGRADRRPCRRGRRLAGVGRADPRRRGAAAPGARRRATVEDSIAPGGGRRQGWSPARQARPMSAPHRRPTPFTVNAPHVRPPIVRPPPVVPDRTPYPRAIRPGRRRRPDGSVPRGARPPGRSASRPGCPRPGRARPTLPGAPARPRPPGDPSAWATTRRPLPGRRPLLHRGQKGGGPAHQRRRAPVVRGPHPGVGHPPMIVRGVGGTHDHRGGPSTTPGQAGGAPRSVHHRRRGAQAGPVSGGAGPLPRPWRPPGGLPDRWRRGERVPYLGYRTRRGAARSEGIPALLRGGGTPGGRLPGCPELRCPPG